MSRSDVPGTLVNQGSGGSDPWRVRADPSPFRYGRRATFTGNNGSTSTTGTAVNTQTTSFLYNPATSGITAEVQRLVWSSAGGSAGTYYVRGYPFRNPPAGFIPSQAGAANPHNIFGPPAKAIFVQFGSGLSTLDAFGSYHFAFNLSATENLRLECINSNNYLEGNGIMLPPGYGLWIQSVVITTITTAPAILFGITWTEY